MPMALKTQASAQGICPAREKPVSRWRLFLLPICLAAYFTALPACRRIVPLKPYTAYVLDRQSATLAAVNLANFHVTAAVPVAPEPERVLLRPGSRQLYVVSSTGKIGIAAFPPLHLITTFSIGKSAHGWVFSADGRAGYVLDPADHELVFLDCAGATGEAAAEAILQVKFRLRLSSTPSELALSPNGKTLIAASANPGRITFVATETHQLLGAVEVGQDPGSMVILPDNSKVFVADTGEEKISAADIPSQKLLSHIEIGVRPGVLLLKPDGGEIFALSGQASSLVILDAFHDDVEQTFPLGRGPVAGVFRRDMSVLYIANSGDGSVVAMDPQNREVLTSTPVGIEPRALALTPDERLLVVADRAASSLAVLHADPTSLSKNRSVLITTVPVGAAPVDVVVPDVLDEPR
jgi:YVTN family beta-propeller protein